MTIGLKSGCRVNFQSADPTTVHSLSHSATKNSKEESRSKLFLLSPFSVSLYVHGGRDLKEGSISTMWRLNLSGIHQILEDDMSGEVGEWELVQTQGRGPSRISHHTASVRPSKEIVFYGGLKGEESNNEIFLFNPNTNSWLTVNPSVSNGRTSSFFSES